MNNFNFLGVIPVIHSSNLERDLKWYEEKAGFAISFEHDGYAGIEQDQVFIHLQWHAGTADDPLNGGSVIRIFVKNIEPLYREFIKHGSVSEGKLNEKTPWNTKEFGFYDLNKNAIFFVEDLRD